MSATTATLLGALIALGGVLLTVVSTATLNFLQRRHERRLRLEDARRTTYVRVIATVRDMIDIESRIVAAEGRQVTIQRAQADRDSKSPTFSQIESVGLSLQALRERLNSIPAELNELNAAVGPVGGKAVVLEVAKVLEKMTTRNEFGQPVNLNGLMAACREDLGTPDT